MKPNVDIRDTAEARSAFTHVTTCTLAKSPGDSLVQRLQQSRCLHSCSDCYWVERTNPGRVYSPLWATPFHGAPGYLTLQALGELRAKLCLKVRCV